MKYIEPLTAIPRPAAAGRCQWYVGVVVPDMECADFMTGKDELDIGHREGIRAMHSTPLMSRSRRLLGMISTHWEKPHHPTEHDFRALDVLARQAADLVDRAQVEIALRDSEQRLQWLAYIFGSSHDAIDSKDLSGIITTWNKGAERFPLGEVPRNLDHVLLWWKFLERPA